MRQGGVDMSFDPADYYDPEDEIDPRYKVGPYDIDSRTLILSYSLVCRTVV